MLLIIDTGIDNTEKHSEQLILQGDKQTDLDTGLLTNGEIHKE